jgi:F-type H+-transporting ATPase subunit b
MIFLSDTLIDPQSITDKIIPNGIWPFIIQLISTFIMLFIVKKFLYTPIKNMLDQRAEFVRVQLREAAEKEKASGLLQAKLEKEAKQAKADLQRIRQEAQDEIERTKQQLLSEAQLQASMLKQKANEEIILAKQKALAQIEEEIIQVALSATSQLLKREVTSKDNEKMVEDFIKGIRH